MADFFQNTTRLRYKLSQLPAIVQTSIRQAMSATADEIVAAMRELVPVKSGALRDSIAWCWGDAPKGAFTLTTLNAAPAATSTTFKLTIYAGNKDAFWARWVEFGTRAHAPGQYRDKSNRNRDAGKRGHPATPAEPYFYPVWRAYKKRLRLAIVKILNQQIRALKNNGG